MVAWALALWLLLVYTYLPTAGCKDITKTFLNGELDAVPKSSEVEGAPPFNVGAVIFVSCRTGYYNPVSTFTSSVHCMSVFAYF